MIALPGKIWWAVFLLDLTVLAIGLPRVRNQIVLRLGRRGYTRPVMWAAYITNFVFWVGIAHCGTLVSAVLFLFRSHFRRAVYRVAEAMTVFGVLTAGLFPLLHTGRPWFGYWLFPYPTQRQIWPNFRSPLEWDVFAVTTYLTVSSIFFLVGLIPDVAARAIARKHPLMKLVYTILSFGWHGHQQQVEALLRRLPVLRGPRHAARVLGAQRRVVGLRDGPDCPAGTRPLFAPYFVAGAIFSGVAMVINLLISSARSSSSSTSSRSTTWRSSPSWCC